MKIYELDGNPKHVMVKLFSLACPDAGIVKFSLTARWPEDVHRKVQHKTSLPSCQHFMDETGGVYDMQLTEPIRH